MNGKAFLADWCRCSVVSVQSGAWGTVHNLRLKQLSLLMLEMHALLREKKLPRFATSIIYRSLCKGRLSVKHNSNVGCKTFLGDEGIYNHLVCCSLHFETAGKYPPPHPPPLKLQYTENDQFPNWWQMPPPSSPIPPYLISSCNCLLVPIVQYKTWVLWSFHSSKTRSLLYIRWWLNDFVGR